LTEQLAMEQARSAPEKGDVLPIKMGDPRFLASDGWVKMEQNINEVVIHYITNVVTGRAIDFKFVSPPPPPLL
jgi:hypothetical protein